MYLVPKNNPCLLYTLLFLALLNAGCTALPPTQEMSDARQALRAASEAKAREYLPYYVWFAEEHLTQAQQQLEKGRHAYAYARFHALQAKRAASEAYRIAILLVEARLALDAAAAAGNVWRDSEALLAEAEASARAHDFKKALELAYSAKSQGILAVIQARREALRFSMQTRLPIPTELSRTQREALERIDFPSIAEELVEIVPGLSHAP